MSCRTANAAGSLSAPFCPRRAIPFVSAILLAFLIGATPAQSQGDRELERRDAALSARLVLRAYRDRDVARQAELSTPRSREILLEIARQGESHPRFASIFSGWRWTAVERWNGEVGSANYTYTDDPDAPRIARVPFGTDGDRATVVTLVWSFGRWMFEDVHRVPRYDLLLRGTATPPPPPSSLIAAARDGYVDVVQRQLNDGAASLEARDSQQRTPLLLAVAGRHRAVVGLLLAAGAEVNATADDGATPLMLASALGAEGIVRLLLDRGADTDLATERGDTALELAAGTGTGAVVRMLLDADARPTDARGRGALVETAARRNNADSLRALLGTGLPATASALMAASTGGAPDTARALIEAGANVNARSSTGWTPLMSAASATNPAVVMLLLAAGADIDAEDTRGTTALVAAAISGRETAAQTLVEAGAALVPSTLEMAAFGGHEAVVRVLLNAGADPNAIPAGATHMTPLDAATVGGHTRIVELLLAAGAKP